MPVFVSSNCLPQPVRETVNTLTGAGIFNIELGPTQEYDEEVAEFLASIKEVQFIIHNYFPAPRQPFILNLASSNEQLRERSIAQAKKSIELCHLLKSDLFSVHAGFAADPGPGAEQLDFTAADGLADYETAFHNFVTSIKELLNVAVPLGIKVAVENNVCPQGHRQFLLLSEASEFERLFAEVPSSNLGINLDMGHLNVSARSLDFDKYEFVHRVKDKVLVFHLHDNNAITDSHEPLSEDSWILPVLAEENFNQQIPLVLEMHNMTVDQIFPQIDLIKESVAIR